MFSRNSLGSNHNNDFDRELYLETSEDDQFLPPASQSKISPKFWSRPLLSTIIIHLLLFSLNLIIVSVYGNAWFSSKGIYEALPESSKFEITLSYPISQQESNIYWGPMRNFILYEKHKFISRPIYKANGEIDENQPTAFNGPPRPELENEWNKLMKCNIPS